MTETAVAESEPAITPEQLRDLLAAHDAVEEAEAHYTEAKENATAAKKELDGAHAQVSRILREVKTGIPEMPLFGNGEPEDWRAVEVHDLGIPDRVEAALQQGGVRTVGELEDLRAQHGDEWNGSIVGVGEKAKQQIEEAVIDFLAKRKEAQEPQVEGADDEHTQTD